MEQSDTVMIYCSPSRCEHPEGPAKLIRCVEAFPGSDLEMWEVEFVDQPERIHNRLIKRQS
jgi:hypothetical protein